MNIKIAPKATAGFRPYAKAPAFGRTYQLHPELDRLASRHSLSHNKNSYIVPLLVGGIEDLRPDNIAQTKANYLFDVGGVPSYLFEHHSAGLYCVLEGKKFGAIENGSTLFHFDAHPDAKRCLDFLTDDPAYYYQVACDYFYEASWLWALANKQLISKVVWFSSSPGPLFINDNFNEFKREFPDIKVFNVRENYLKDFDRSQVSYLPSSKTILSIDYDYFAYPDIGHIFDSTDLVRYIYRRAGLVTQALSPAYIDVFKASQLACGLMNSVWTDRNKE